MAKNKRNVKNKRNKPALRIAAQYFIVTGWKTVKMITVYTDYSISVGCEQELEKIPSPIALQMPHQPKEKE